MKESCTIHKKAFQSALRGKKLKATPGRLEILDAFAHEAEPLSIKQLQKRIGPGGPDTATLYRNAESLTAEGLLVKVNLGGKNFSYELAGRTHHHHLICKRCGKISDVTISVRPGLDLQALKSAKNFAAVTGHSLEFFGFCKKCKIKAI